MELELKILEEKRKILEMKKIKGMSMVQTGRQNNISYSGKYMQVGKFGENLALKAIKERFPTATKLIDAREFLPCQSLDFDYVVELADGRRGTIEIKTDTYLGKSPNFLFELCRINHQNLQVPGFLGWGFRSRADFLFVVAPSISCVFCCYFPTLRKAIQAISQHEQKISVVKTDNCTTTINLLIKFENIRHLFQEFRI